ncbi:MAG: amidase [Pseudomonadota bacterium]
MKDATDLAANIAAGKLSAVQAMQASLAATERFSDLGAIARLEPGMGTAAAQAFDQSEDKGDLPFGGVPFLAKDLGGYSAGLGPVAGSPALARVSKDPEEDDDLFKGFRAMGLLPFGLTTVPEFGLALSCEPPGVPPALNPFDRSYSPGGSSGGAAAAVAAGIVSIAHATDAAGSTRVPAACCGLVGLKATRGRVPGAPHFNNHLMGIASEFVLTRSVRDAITAFEAIKLGNAEPGAAIRSVGICVPGTASAATGQRMSELREALEGMGVAVNDLTPPDAIGSRAMELAGAIFAASLASWLDSVSVDPSDITPICAALYERGKAMPAQDLFEVHTDLVRLSHEGTRLFDTIDTLIMPVLADGPPKVGFFDPNQTDPGARYAQMSAVAPNVALANVAGLPGLAMPFGMLPEPRAHLPFGFQMMGPHGSDEALFELAAQIEAIAPKITYPHPLAGAS